ncbi:MAG: hypothetical protein ACI9S8_003261 [Chlamydiales bacterium]|jgi:hypothetical protein
MDTLQERLKEDIDKLSRISTMTVGTCATITGFFALSLAPPPISIPIVFSAWGGILASKKYAKNHAVREFKKEFGAEVTNFKHLQENLRNSPDIILGRDQIKKLINCLRPKSAECILRPLIGKMGMVQKEAFLGNKKGCGIMPLEYV